MGGMVYFGRALSLIYSGMPGMVAIPICLSVLGLDVAYSQSLLTVLTGWGGCLQK